jgi:hypothetical protein
MEQKEDTTEGIGKTELSMLIGFLIFIVLIASWGWQKWQYRKAISTLTSISPEQVTMFRIYPRVIIPVDEYIKFKAPDPIVTDFFQALTDHRPYSYSHDRVWGHQEWFFEVAAGEVFIQISFHIPYEKGEIVAGRLGKYTKNSMTSYGCFQSQQLYQWYQKYSHRWLTPEES